MKKVAITLALISLPVLSGNTLAGDAEAGKAKYAVCGGCHGPTGAGNEALKYPKLTGQTASYVVEQLKAYKSGARDNATMRAMVAGLTEADMENIAAYTATFK